MSESLLFWQEAFLFFQGKVHDMASYLAGFNDAREKLQIVLDPHDRSILALVVLNNELALFGVISEEGVLLGNGDVSYL